MTTFLATPEEAQSIALAVLAHLQAQGLTVRIETAATGDAPYRTTLLAKKQSTRVLIEAQGTPIYHASLRDLSGWLALRQMNSELYLAVAETSELSGVLLRRLKDDGIGLLLVTAGGEVVKAQEARNPALMVSLDESLALGQFRAEVRGAFEKFNNGSRKDALRDMCDLVERDAKALARRAARKRYLIKTESELAVVDLASTINLLASAQQYAQGHVALVDSDLKDDLHSFRTARNLIDHPAPTRRAERDRERQFGERMLMGARLVSEIRALHRRTR